MFHKKYFVWNIVLISWILFLTAASISNAQTDLSYYLNAAFKNSPALKESVGLIQINEIEKKLAESRYSLPQISLTSNYLFAPFFNNNGKIISANPDPGAVGYDVGITNGGLYSAQLNFEKNIFNGGLIDAYKNQSEINIAAQKNSSELIRHNIIKDVTDQYINAYQAQQMLLLSKSVRESLENQEKLTEELVNKGLSKQSELLLLRIEIQNQHIQSDQLDGEVKKILAELNTLCGLKDSADTGLKKAELEIESKTRGTGFLKQFENDSLLVENQQSVFETKYLPQVNLFFNTGLNAVEIEGIQKKLGLSAGINFSLPIYDGDQKNLTKQQTEISLKSIHSYKENQRLAISNRIRDSKIQIELNRKNLQNIKTQMEQYDQALKLAQAELNRGQFTVIEYITMIRNYLELKKNLVTTECSLLFAINQYNYWNW